MTKEWERAYWYWDEHSQNDAETDYCEELVNFKAGWEAAIDQVLRRCWTRKTDWDNYDNVKRDLTQLLDVAPDNPQS